MLIPIGHDSGTVRRQPWVTWGLMAACLAVFLYTNPLGHDVSIRHQRKVMEAIGFFSEHPYLIPPSELEPHLGGNWEEERGALLEMLDLSGRARALMANKVEEQAKLDALAAEAAAIRTSHPFYRWGLVASQPTAAGAVGHMFLHGGWLHLLGNLLLLFLTGTFIEDKWGRPLYTAFFLLAGLAGAGLFMSRFPELTTPLVGASGAIAGCMGAFVVRFAGAKLRYLYWFGFVVGTFTAPAWLMLPIWFAMEFAMAHVTEGLAPMGGAGVAHWAHVGGFGFGLAVAGLMRFMHVEERFVHRKIEAKIGVVANDAVHAALEAAAEGRAEAAFDMLLRAARRDPSNREAAHALWDVAVSLERAAEAAPALLRLIHAELRDGQPELAVQHVTELAQHAPDAGVEPALALRLAPALAAQGHARLAADVLARALGSPDLTAPLALHIAREARHADPAICARAARRALEAPGAGPRERAEARALLEEVQGAVDQAGSFASRADVAAGARRALGLDLKGEPDDAPPTLAGLDLEGEPDDAGPTLELREPDTEIDLGAPTRPVAPGDPEIELEAGSPDTALDPALRDTAVVGAPGEWGDLAPAPDAFDAPAGLRALRVAEALPVSLGLDALTLDVAGRGKTRLRLEKVQALAVAAVRELGAAKPVLVLDLAINWLEGGGQPLQVVRLRTDRFDPRRIAPRAATPMAALRALVEELLGRSGARPLPDRQAVLGEPSFAVYDSLSAYEREVWLATR